MFIQPRQYLRVPSRIGRRTRPSVPRAVVLPRPPQHLQVPAPSGTLTRPCIPRALSLPRPMQQHLQVPTLSGGMHTSSRPTSSLAPAPTATPPGARPKRPPSTVGLIPRTVVLPRPLWHLQVSAPSGCEHVISSHGQWCSRAHFNTSRCPPRAANAHPIVLRAV